MALSNGDYDSAFDTFNSIADYKDSQTQAKEAVYKKGMAVLNKAEFDTAYEAFSSISGYHDSDTMAKEAIYKKATVAFYKKDYDGAYTTYSSISDYGDSAIKAKESIYRKAALLMENGSFQEAADCFDLITDYRDSQAQSTICRNELDYLNATELLNKGSYSKAGECFESLGSYRDSDELMRKAYYLSAKELIDMGVLRGAYTVLNTKVNTDNRSYEDSVDLANSIGYQYADNCFNEGQYDAAMSIFEELADYEDSSARYLETKYQYGLSLIDDGRYEEAEQLFKELDNYKDSQTQNKEARYQRALIFLSKSDYTKAESLFEDLGNYKDSQTQLKEAKYQDALGYQYKLLRDYKRSVTIFKELGNYKDSVEQWKAAMYAYVKANYNNNNSTTYEYLTELKRYNYEDSKSCYEDLYTWKINGYVNTSKDDYSTHLTTITSYTKNVSFHYELSGGTPGEIISLYEITIFPDGSSMKSDYTFDDRMDGDTFCSYWNGYFMNNPEYGKAGILKSKLYNVKTGKLIGEVSVQVTS